MESLRMNYEDQDLSKSDLKHEPTSNLAVNNKAEKGMEKVEIKNNGTAVYGSCLMSEILLSPLEEQVDSETKTLRVNNGPSLHLGQEVLGGVAASQDDMRRPSGGCSVPEDDAQNLIEELEEPQVSSPLLSNEGNSKHKCPVCTELYDAKHYKDLPLMCKHVFCNKCAKTMFSNAQHDRVTCPVCQKRTQLTESGIRNLQEQMLSEDATTVQEVDVRPEQVVQRRGLGRWLEYKFQRRLEDGTLPLCMRYDHGLVDSLNALKNRCLCLYYCALLVLCYPEAVLMSLLLVPIIIIILVIAIRG